MLIKYLFAGFDVYDDCGLAQKTMSLALDVLDGPVLGSSTCKENSICNLGKAALIKTQLNIYSCNILLVRKKQAEKSDV